MRINDCSSLLCSSVLPLPGTGLQVIHPSGQEHGTQGDGENGRDQVAHGFASRQESTWEPNTRRNSASSVTPSRSLSKASSIISGQVRSPAIAASTSVKSRKDMHSETTVRPA